MLFDDRKASPGVKFADAELVGVPTAGRRRGGPADGLLKVKDSPSGERVEISVANAVVQLRSTR